MTHKEKCDACDEAYKEYKVDELREVSIKAFNIARNSKGGLFER